MRPRGRSERGGEGAAAGQGRLPGVGARVQGILGSEAPDMTPQDQAPGFSPRAPGAAWSAGSCCPLVAAPGNGRADADGAPVPAV